MVVGVICFEPGSLSARLVAATGTAGWWCALMLALVAGVALLDVIVNDMMPPGYAMPSVYKRRHIVYMVLAIGLMSMAYMVSVKVGPSALHLRLALDAGVAATIAFLDLFARHRQ